MVRCVAYLHFYGANSNRALQLPAFLPPRGIIKYRIAGEILSWNKVETQFGVWRSPSNTVPGFSFFWEIKIFTRPNQIVGLG